MILKQMMRLVASSAVLGTIATSASGQVYVHAEATALVRFLEVREITNGTPIGGTGLNLHRWLGSGGVGSFQPPRNIRSGAGGMSGPPIAGAGVNAPLPNTGFSYGFWFDALASPYGFGLVGEVGSYTINYTNITGGHSEYEIDGELLMSLSLISDLTDPLRENVLVSGQVTAIILDENGFNLTESVFLVVSGLNSSGSVTSRAYPFTMRIGNIGGGYRRDLAEIRFEFRLLAAILAVPSPGVLVLMSMAGLLAVRRRRS